MGELEDVTNRLKLNFGRSVGGVTWQMNRIRQDPNRPGFFDLDHMREIGNGSKNYYNTRTNIHPFNNNDWVMTSHISPLYPNGRETNEGFAPGGFGAVGQFYANLLSLYYGEDSEPKPRYVEVLNEPFVHANELGATTKQISQFHNVVADSIRAYNPEVKVGGFTAAWPEFERNNFGVWDNTWKTFIDEAGANMDFYSFHIYDTPTETDPSYRRGSNTEAIFDMIEQYSMLEVGEVKPMMISEYGGCCAGWDGPYYEERDWQQMKSISSMTMSFMERPHRILKAIPFIVDKATWYTNNNPYPYPHVLLRKVNGQWEYTHLEKYYRLWSNLEGIRVSSSADDADIQIDAYVDSNKVYVVLNNLEDQDKIVQLEVFDSLSTFAAKVDIKHLYAINRIPQLDELELTTAPSEVTIGAEGTLMLEYTYADAILVDKQQNQKKYYADSYLKRISSNRKISFQLADIEVPQYGTATLRVSAGRDHNRSLIPKVWINGVALVVPDDWSGYDQKPRQRFFGTIEIPVPMSLLASDNQVEVSYSGTGGHISTVTLEVNSFDYKPRRTSTSTEDLDLLGPDFKVFPTPTDDYVSLEWSDEVNVQRIQLLAIDGSHLKEAIINNGRAQFSGLSAGMYLIQVDTPTDRYVKKIVAR